MPSPSRLLAAAGAAIVLSATVAWTQEVDAGAAPHVRGSTLDTMQLLKELVERSATARDLVARIDRSDVTLYIRHQWFNSSTLRGRIGFLASSTLNHRMLIIELSARYPHFDQLAALGHELQHAYEIASVPSVRDPRSLSDYYRRIGEPSRSLSGAETFETAAAAAAGRRIRAELVGAPAHAAADAVVDDDRN
jgi:hypothetical protein